jgi:putative FmdB family regulatory protein
MPTYGYECLSCANQFEVFQSIKDDALTLCDSCGGTLRKRIYPVGISFKGSGFYVNDYAAKPSASPGAAASSESAAPAASSEAKADSKSEAKTETKSETKAEPKSEPAKSESKSEIKASVSPAP